MAPDCLNYKKIIGAGYYQYNASPVEQQDTAGALAIAISFKFTTPTKAEKETFMSIRLLIAFFLSIQFFCSCISYDKSLVYKSGYDKGKNTFLLTEGYYTYDSVLSPIYFYSNGSVLLSPVFKDTLEIKNSEYGYWGNYKISNDTILIETFAPNGGTWRMERNLQKGIITEKSIHFINSTDRKGVVSDLNETINFVPFDYKPDSSFNWIRKKRKYNR